jgi:hypothetical protein
MDVITNTNEDLDRDENRNFDSADGDPVGVLTATPVRDARKKKPDASPKKKINKTLSPTGGASASSGTKSRAAATSVQKKRKITDAKSARTAPSNASPSRDPPPPRPSPRSARTFKPSSSLSKRLEAEKSPLLETDERRTNSQTDPERRGEGPTPGDENRSPTGDEDLARREEMRVENDDKVDSETDSDRNRGEGSRKRSAKESRSTAPKKITFVMRTKVPFASPVPPDLQKTRNDAEGENDDDEDENDRERKRRRLLQEADDDPIEDSSEPELGAADVVVATDPARPSKSAKRSTKSVEPSRSKKTDGESSDSRKKVALPIAKPKTLRKTATPDRSSLASATDTTAAEAARRGLKRKRSSEKKKSRPITEMAGLAMPVGRIKTALGLSLGSRFVVSRSASVAFAAQTEFFVGELVKRAISAKRYRRRHLRGLDDAAGRDGSVDSVDGFTVADIRAALRDPVFSGILPRGLVLPFDAAPGIVNIPPTKKENIERLKTKKIHGR